jgi:hypothetical protein
MPGGKKIMKTTIKKWAHYALPTGFVKLGYPKDSNYHMININMMGRKNLPCGYQIIYRQCRY